MALISLTRLRLASPRYLPAFMWYTLRSALQARSAPGFRGLRVLKDRKLAFWTITAWDDLASMKHFRSTGAHRIGMPKLARYCDEASVTRWLGPAESISDWEAACARMLTDGEASHVGKPSPQQLARAWAAPLLAPPRQIAVPGRRSPSAARR